MKRSVVFLFAANLFTAAGAEEKSLYAALGGGLFVNGVFHGAGRLFGADFAQTSLESYRTNLTSAWVWDNDAFLFNHPGHPYQGGLYHAAARASGFSFYESMFFDAIGSVTWELFGETDIPSYNDLIITTFGGAVFGEMTHRLYLEASSAVGRIAASPMDTITNAALRKRPRQTRNLYYLSAISGGSFIRSSKGVEREFDAGNKSMRRSIYNIDTGFSVIYGNPFTHESNEAYSQFEIATQMGGSFWPFWLDWTIITEGYLLAFNPVFTERDALSTGLSMHYDMIAGSNINFSSQAFDWSVKWKHDFAQISTALKASAGWTVFGSSQYYPGGSMQSAENDFGTGGNLKFTFSILTKKPRLGALTLGAYNYLIFMIPRNKPDSRGADFINLSFLEYGFPFTPRFSININNSLYFKHTNSQNFEDTVEIANRVMLFAKWTFVDRGRDAHSN